MSEEWVVFDTNVLPVSSGLDSPLWLGIFRLCKKAGINACLPSIVVHESVNMRREAFEEASGEYLTAFKKVSRLYDAAPVYIPGADEVSESWRAELLDGFQILDVHGDDASEALEREASRKPPARAGKGSRDSAIWLTAVRLAKTGVTVHLVSRNTKDFGDRDGKNLHSVLLEEAAQSSVQIMYHVGLDEFIEHVATSTEKPTLETAALLSVVLDDLKEELVQQLSDTEGLLEDLSADEISALSVSFNSSKVLRAYVIDDDGFALVDCAGEVAFDESSAHVWIDFRLRAWIEYEIDSKVPLSGEVYSLDLG